MTAATAASPARFRQGRRPLAVRAAARAVGRHQAGQAGDQSLGRRAAASDPAVRRPGAAGPSQRFRPLSGQQGHRGLPQGRRRLARPALQAAAADRPRDRSHRAQRHARGPVPRRHRGQALRAARAPASPRSSIPNPFYAAYSAGAAAADCEPVYLPTTRETGFLPDLDAHRRGAAGAHRRVLSRLAVEPAGRGRRRRLSRAARRHGAALRLPGLRRRVLLRDLSQRPAAARHAGSVGARTSPTSWCSTRCRSAPTCPACASASPPATAASSPATSSCATSRRRRCRCRRRRSRSRPTATRRMSRRTASSTSRSSISPTRSSATATATSGRPAASSSGSTSARTAATRRSTVEALARGRPARHPRHYLARDGADGRNPGAGYIRVALVQDKEITAEALHRLVAVLG